MSKTANTGKEPWIAQFDEEIDDCGEETCESALSAILKNFLLSEGDSAAATTAGRIDNLYKQEYLRSDPLMKFEDDQGLGGFLDSFYELVFTLARLVPYDSWNQLKLVLLITELRKLPPRQSKVWDEDCLLWTQEPVFAGIMEDNWNGNYPSDGVEKRDGDGKKSFQEICHEWVNFSCFIARCIEAGLNDNYENGCKYADVDIGKGLDEDIPRGPKRACKVMVAAQYILLAGRKLAYESFAKPEQWRRWAEKLGEISRQEDENTVLASATKEAHEYLVYLLPEIVSAP